MSQTRVNLSNLAHYRIIEKIGAGGMGEVYLAEDLRLERKVAVKLLNRDLSDNDDHLRRFVQEAKAASALNHPNIITIHEIGKGDNLHFIATEYIRGETLRERMKRDALSLREIVEIAVQIASALAVAHEAGIIHRDIKPENIMLREDRLVKILDFGLAKLTETKSIDPDTEAETRPLIQTSPGLVMGTAGYMSPEQARGRPVDARTDIWSLGVMLYEMIAGRAPFQGETAADVFASILHHDPAPLAGSRPDLPGELERIVAKMLRKDPDERYQTAKDLHVDLKRLHRQIDRQDESERPAAPEPITGPDSVNPTPTLRKQTTAGFSGLTERIRRPWMIAGLAFLLVAGAAAYWFYAARPGAPALVDSIAVLPFENASGDPELDYLSDGVSESVIDRLSQLPQLKVIARSSSFRYRDRDLNVQEIARALGVRAIVTGRVLPRGDSFSIRVELVDALENTQLWGQNFTRRASDLQTLQTDISRDIAENLRLRLSGTEVQQFAGRGTPNPEAYELLLRGRFYFNKAGTPENFHRAVDYWEQATALDPQYALAFAELTEAYGFGGGRGLDARERLARREAAAQKALELDYDLAEAHHAMAGVRRARWEWREAEHAYQRAIALNPNLARAHVGYAQYLSLMRRHDEALAEAIRARELDPLSLITNTNIGIIYFGARRYDEAVQALQKALEPGEAAFVARQLLGKIYAVKGMYPEAAAEFEEALKVRGGNSPGTEALLGTVRAMAGDRPQAEQILRKLEADRNGAAPYELAALYGVLDRRDEALAVLEKAYASRIPNLPLIAVDPFYDRLRDDPRFADLVRRMGLPQ